MTRLTLSISIPLPNKLVATSILFWKSLNCWYRISLFNDTRIIRIFPLVIILLNGSSLNNVMCVNSGHLSVCSIALCIVKTGKFCSSRRSARAWHRLTELTKTMTWWGKAGQVRVQLRRSLLKTINALHAQ